MFAKWSPSDDEGGAFQSRQTSRVITVGLRKAGVIPKDIRIKPTDIRKKNCTSRRIFNRDMADKLARSMKHKIENATKYYLRHEHKAESSTRAKHDGESVAYRL